MPSWLSRGGYRELVREPHQPPYLPTLRLTFIGLNTLVYFGWTYAADAADVAYYSSDWLVQFMEDNFNLRLRNVDASRWWTYLTAALSHKTFIHLAVNMFAFHRYVPFAFRFGLRPLEIVLLCAGSAVAGSVVTVKYWRMGGMADLSFMGASGLMWGLGLATTLLRPNALWCPSGTFPLWVMTGVYFSYDWFRVRDENKRVGHAAHLGGLSFGLLYYLTRPHGTIVKVQR